MERRFKLGGEFFLALGTSALGVFLAIQTAGIEVSPSYARVGPRVFPWVVSFALVGLGLWIAYDVYRTRKAKSEADPPAAAKTPAAASRRPASRWSRRRRLQFRPDCK